MRPGGKPHRRSRIKPFFQEARPSCRGCNITRMPVFLGIEVLAFLDDLENHLAIRPRGGSVENGADGFGRAPLLANNPAEIVFCDFQLQHRRGVPLGLFHLDRIGVANQLAG